MSCCGTTRSATPTTGRCGCTCRPGTTPTRTAATPSVYVIQGYTGHVAMWRNRAPFRQPFTETADAVFARGEAPPALVVYVDAWTSYGGSQFVDSPGTGRYHSYLCEEVVPWVDRRYRTLAAPRTGRSLGKSSGGFGAMITPMLRPDLFGALATHAGDALYELVLHSGLRPGGAAAAGLRRRHLAVVGRLPVPGRRSPRPADEVLLGLLGVAACFSAHEDGTVDLPFDPRTGALRPEVWERWLDWDPVRMAPRYAGALRSLRAIWIDAGHQGRVLPGPGRGGVPAGAARGRRHRRRDPVRAVRRDPRRHRLPVPAVAGLALPAHRRLRFDPKTRVERLRPAIRAPLVNAERVTVANGVDTMRNRWLAASVLAAAAVVGLAACGGSSSSTSSARARPARRTRPALGQHQQHQHGRHGGRDQDRDRQRPHGAHRLGRGSCSTGSRTDTPTTSNCNGTCATYWPPLIGTPSLASGVTLAGKLGHDQAGQRPAPGHLRRPSAVPVQGRHQRGPVDRQRPRRRPAACGG